MRKLILVLSFLFIFASQAGATIWYVDALNGNDSNTTNAPYPGPSGTGPYKTANKMSLVASDINPGDIVAFKSGPNEVYRPANGQNAWVYRPNAGGAGFAGTTSNPVIVTSYGEGPLPVIDGADCAGAQVGNCYAGPIVGGNSWAVFSGSIYREAWTIKPYTIYRDSESGWPSLRSATCTTGTCVSIPHGGVVTVASRLPFWSSGTSYVANDAIQNGGNWYTAVGSGSGGSAPTCTTGTCGGSGSNFTYRGRSSAVIQAMTPGSWYWDGSFLYIWMPDGSNPNTHSLEVSDVFQVYFISETNGEMNGITTDHIHIRHGCIGYEPLSGAASASLDTIGIQNSMITMQGTGPVDTTEACNNTFINGGNNTHPGNNMFFLNNRMGYASHGGMTMQCLHNTVIEGNDVGPASHGNINFPVATGCVPLGTKIIGNVVHTGTQSVSNIAGQFNGQANGIYIESLDSTSIIAKNIVYNLNDVGGCALYNVANCSSAIQTYGATGGLIEGNTIEGTGTGFAATNGSAGLVVRDNIVSTAQGVNDYAVDIGTTCSGCTFDHNDWFVQGGQANIGLINGVPKTFAQWQSAGNDPNGKSVDPINILPSSTYWLLKKMEALDANL